MMAHDKPPVVLLHPILLEVASLAMRKIPVGARLGISADGPLLISIGVVSFFVCFIGVIWVAIDGQKQGWHDKVAGTYVEYT